MASNYGRDYQGMSRYGSGMNRGYGSDYGSGSSGGYGGRGSYGMDYLDSGERGGSMRGGTYGESDRGYEGGYGGFGRSGQTGGRGGYGSDYGYGGGYSGSQYGGSQYGGPQYGGGYGGGYGQGGYGQGGSQYGGSYGGSQYGAGMGGMQSDETSRVRVSEVMTRDPETVTAEATLADAARKMRDMDVGIIPVVESEQNKRLRGVITDRDIAIRAVAEGKDVKTAKVSEIMTTDVETCNQNDAMRDVLNVMQREQVRRVPITDREGRLVGIVAQADVATDFGGGQGQRDYQVAETVERISEPAQPRRGGNQSMSGGGMQAESRSGQQSQSGQQNQSGQKNQQSQGGQNRGSQSRGENEQ